MVPAEEWNRKEHVMASIFLDFMKRKTAIAS
jgi:hypothetical protein